MCYTRYVMYVAGENNKLTQEQVDGVTKELDNLDIIGYALEDDPAFNPDCPEYGAEYLSYEECTWRQHDEHMLEISKKFPKLTFKLYGTEDDGYMYYTLYHNGDSETVESRVVWPKSERIKWTLDD